MGEVRVNKYRLHTVVVNPGNEGKVSSAADEFFTHAQHKVNGNLLYR